MRLTFLGGADEVGASCTLVELGDARVLVDCGIRVGGGAGDRLPHLAGVGDPASLAALVLTHAHLDHTGAGPLLMAPGRSLPVLTTAATRDVVEVLLRDVLAIARHDADQEIPLYPPAAVDAFLGAVRPTPFLTSVPVDGGTVSLTLHPAGHVLGAAMVHLASSAGSVLVTGDLAVSAQRTVPGCRVPPLRPDVMVVESTYGGRLHGNRQAEEARLLAAVDETLAGGGHVLIPAFALGRAQEVIVILERAMRQGRIRSAPIIVDGMVRPICGLYARHAELLTPPLRRRALKTATDPILGDGSLVRRIGAAAERDAVLDGPPCVVVASSGMLAGGASVVYARRLLADPRALVALTGYQDEESPGRRLLDAASGAATTLAMEGTEVPVACRVAFHGLSAHADEGQLVALVAQQNPRHVVLVHGDGPARAALARALAPLPLEGLHLPCAGDELTLDDRRRRRHGPPPTRVEDALGDGVGGDRPLDDEGLTHLWLWLRQRRGPGARVTVDEMLAGWYGPTPPDGARGDLVRRILGSPPGFEPDPRHPFIVRLVEPPAAAAAPPGPLDQTASIDAARAALAADPDFQRSGVDADGRLVLSFAFPGPARTRSRPVVHRLAETTGRTVVVADRVDHGALADLALGLLPPEAQSARAPSVHLAEALVVLHLRERDAVPFDAEARLREAFLERSGFRLELRQAPCAAPSAGPGSPRPGGPWEINAAYARVHQAFAALPHRPRKVGLKQGPDGPFIELSFVSPGVGRRHAALLDELTREIGYLLAVGGSVDQQTLQTLAREKASRLGTLLRTPAVHLAEGRVVVRLAAPPQPGPAAEAITEYREATDFELVLGGP